jgi:ribosomal protein S18 acetylase RimI-like enzyme
MGASTRGSEGRHDGDSELIIRAARADDRDGVLAFCADIWEGHDYIPYVWDDWLHDVDGTFLVAEAGGRPVGIVHVLLVTEREAWLEGIRVDPTERRQGIARTLVSQALVAARQRGAEVARLMTSAANTASQQLIARFGFTRVAELVRYEAPADADGAGGELPGKRHLTTPGDGAFDRIWEWLMQSNLRPFTGGLEILDWTARALSEPALHQYLSAGVVWTLQEWDTLQALAIAMPPSADDESDDEGRALLRVRYTDGAADGLGQLALALRGVAAEHALTAVDLWLPNLLILHDAMQGAGYTRQDEAPVELYAREL